jgi:hypothetical protein
MGVSGEGAPEDEILNPIPPDYYDIEGPHRLTYNEQRAIYPNILIDSEDNLHLIWSDSRNDPDPNDEYYFFEIFYKKLDGDGNQVVGDTQLTDVSNFTNWRNYFYYPAPVAALDSQGNIHMAYHDGMKNVYATDNRANVEIYYMKLDGHLDYSGAPGVREDVVLIDEQRVSEGVAHSGGVDIALDSNDNVHMVWYDHRSAWYNYEIYYEKLSIDGDVLVDDKRLTYYLDYAAGPELVIDSEDNLHVAFKSHLWDEDQNRIFYMKLDNNGDHIIEPKIVIEEDVLTPYPWYKYYPYIVLDSEDNLHMTWHDESNSNDFDLYYLKLDNTGEWLMDEPFRITDNPGRSRLTDFIINEYDHMFIIWTDNTPGDYQIFLAILDADCTYLMEPYQLTVSESLTDHPALAIDNDGFLHVAFMDTIADDVPEIYHIVFVPRIQNLAFVPTGTPGGSTHILIYENDEVVDHYTVVRTAGNPYDNMVLAELWINPESSYRLEFYYTGPPEKGKSNGAMPLKVYTVENGELVEQVLRTVVNDNQGKHPKLISTLMLDDIL